MRDRFALTSLAGFAAVLTAAAVLAVLLFLLVSAWPLLRSGEIVATLIQGWRPYADDPVYGVGPMVLVTCLMAIGAVGLAFPAALGLVAFVHGVGPRRLRRPVLLCVQFMAGIPTVVYGFVAVMVLVPLLRSGFDHGTGFSLLAALLTLSLLILPTMVLVLEARLGQQDQRWMIGCRALGMTRSQTLQRVLFPQARGAMVTALVLGFSRAVGDTLIALMVAGNAAQLPGSLLDSVRSLTSHIALVLATDSFSPEYRSVAAAALFLFLLTSSLSLVLRRLARQEVES